jgi:hypothetical protein
MKINIIQSHEKTKLSDLDPGEVFMHDGEIYISAGPCDGGLSTHRCTDVENGVVSDFSGDVGVVHYPDATLMLFGES